jgi:3-oxoacyl-[acyl-carrier-protein] synthase II
MERAVITGVGPISAVGQGAEEFWDALVSGRTGIGPITRCDVSRSASKIGAEVKDFQLERYVTRGRMLPGTTPRPVQLALAAATLAVQDAGIEFAAENRDRFGVYAGTSVGQVEDIFVLRDAWLRLGRSPSAHTAVQIFNHATACALSSYFDLRGPIHTTSTGCNSGMDALGQAAREVELGLVDGVLVVGTDDELVAEILQLLNASHSLATRWNDQPSRASRPFDIDRDGNVIGEGAAALMIESEAHALARGVKSYARVAGYAVCSAGRRRYRSDRPDPDTRPCARALREAMRYAGWAPQDLQVFNANGSSSRHYDLFEAMALGETFGPSLSDLLVHSTKSALGQHGAGSSALQVVAACLTLERGQVPPTLNCDHLDPACGPIRLNREAVSVDVDRVLVHSIGLGGFYYSAMALEALGAGVRRHAAGSADRRGAPGRNLADPRDRSESISSRSA